MTAKHQTVRPYPPDFVSIETLAYRLDCSPSTARQYVDAGLIPAPIRLGSLVRWRWSEVEAHLSGPIAGQVQTHIGSTSGPLDDFSKAVLNHGKTA